MAKIQKRGDKFTIRWTDEDGCRRRDSFDNARDAKFTLQQRQSEVEEVRRGIRNPKAESKTFDELCDYWLEKRAPLKRSYDDDVSIIRTHLRPAFTGIKLRDLGVAHIDTFKIKKLSILKSKTVFNMLTLLISMLALAVELNWLAESPKIKKPKQIYTGYSYLRTIEEIHRFLSAALSEGEMVYAMYATAVFTGGRAGELAGLDKKDVDLENRLITFRRSYDYADGVLKDDEIRYAPILDPLFPILGKWMETSRDSILFPNRAGKRHTESARVFQEVLHRVLDSAGFPKTLKKVRAKDGGELYERYITFHDLRHTFASHWVMNDGTLYKLAKILGHSSEEMTKRYAHLCPNAFATEYGRFGNGYSRDENPQVSS